MGTRSVNWMRRAAFALVAALALAVVSGAGPTAQQASAGSYLSRLCWVEWVNGQPKVECVDIPVAKPWDDIFDCPQCGAGIDWRHDPVIRDDFEGLVGQHVTNGLAKLGAAAFTTDPVVRERLRAEAVARFDAATRYASQSRMTFAAYGLADDLNDKFVPVAGGPSPDPWLPAAGRDVADGITLLQQALREPRNAARLRAQALVQFDEAYTELSQHEVIGS